MNDHTHKAVPLVARILLAALFLPSGLMKLAAFGGTEQYYASLGVPAPALVVAATIAVEVIGGVLLLAGYKTRIAAATFVAFTALAGLVAHGNFADQIQMILFMKNVAIIGGLLMVIDYGAGELSVDARMRPAVVPQSAAA